jgi:DNA primase
LYGINLAAVAIRAADAAVIVEGYLDVIISHQYGFTNTVASMGTAINEKQLYILKKLSPNLILALDADAAGEEATSRCVPFENLLEHEIRVVVAPAGKDPDDVIKADAEIWRHLLVSATPIVDFVFEKASEPVNLRTAKGKADLAAKILPVIAGINNPVRRAHYLSLLAGRVGTTSADLQYSLAQLKLPQMSTKTTPTSSQAVSPGVANPIEDYFLALLLKHPELKSECAGFRPEYLESIENREIFGVCLSCENPALFKEMLDPAVWDRYQQIAATTVVEDRLAERLAECVWRLEEKHLKSSATKIKEILDAESDRGSAAELLRYKEQGLSLDSRLAELFKRKEERRRSPRR